MSESSDLPPLDPSGFEASELHEAFPRDTPAASAATYGDPSYLSAGEGSLSNPVRHRRTGMVALAVAVAATLVTGIVAVTALTGAETNTPQAAVSAMLTAAGNSDVLGVLDHLDPAERDIIAPFLTSGIADLKRLGILSSTADLGHVAGVGVTFENVTMTTASIRSDLSAVTITGGSVRGRVDPAQLPFGPVVQQRQSGTTPKVVDKSSPLHITMPVVTVRRGDTWFVSIGYTAAEAIRHKDGLALPAVGVPAVGATSATEAVDDFLRAAASLDVRRLIELTPPDEMGALHDYAPLFLSKLTSTIAKYQSGQHAVTITITDLGLTSKDHRGGQLVKITKLGVRATSGATTVQVSPGAKCVKVTSTDPTPPVFPGECGTHAPFGLGSSVTCSSGATASAGADTCVSTPDPNAKSPYSGLSALGGIHPDLGIVTVERAGKWYVSPLRTTFDNLEAVLSALTPDVVHRALDGGLGALGLLSLPLAILGTRSASQFSGMATSIGSPGDVPVPIGSMVRPAATPCIGGKQTLTFPTVPGQPKASSVQVPCTVPPG